MKVKVLSLLLASCLVAVAAWLVHVPNPVPADEIPEKYRGTVAKGLEYLAKNQHKDGHWQGDDGKHPVAMTGLVGLALLMEGSNAEKGKYSANIRQAVDWLMEKSDAKRDGLIFSGHASETDRYMEGHGLATLFLAGALTGTEGERNKKLSSGLKDSVKYIVKAQSSRGGWYRTSKVEGHDLDAILATVIQIQALQAAENSGIAVPDKVVKFAQEYLKNAIGENEEKAKDGKSRSQPAEVAGALACRVNSIAPNQINSEVRRFNDGLCKKWFNDCRSAIPVGRAIQFGRDDVTHYYYAQAVFLNGDGWKDYRAAMFDHLLDKQNKDGSWPAGDGFGVGPIYSTAVWCTILQLDNSSHPSTLQPGSVTITLSRPEVWQRRTVG
jgi:Squalene-hopene cyclase C-terminal domain/Prenyltransferase and squalene oxidase repeat